MSSHDLYLRTTVRLKPGVGLCAVWSALGPDFSQRYSISLTGPITEGCSELPLANLDDTITLSDGVMHLNLLVCGPGDGVWPADVLAAIERLQTVVDDGAAVELIDLDASPGVELQCVSVEFIGPDEEARRAARLRYGLERARPWLSPVIGETGFRDLLARVLDDFAPRQVVR